jgi:plasmid stabilization system protein ParE
MEQPYLGLHHSELTRLLGEEVRSRLIAPYRIYYRLGRSGPEIISILHGARNQRSILTSRFTQ